jgi:hypothetical protein
LKRLVTDHSLDEGAVVAAEVTRLSGKPAEAIKTAERFLASGKKTPFTSQGARAVLALAKIQLGDLLEARVILVDLENEVQDPKRPLLSGVSTAGIRRRLEAKEQTSAPPR